MQALEIIKRKVESAQDLQSVVRTMKALAAVSIRQYERAVESLAEYNRTIEMGLQVLIRAKPEAVAMADTPSSDRLGAIIFGSQQGMCGQFNERIVSFAMARMSALGIPRGSQAILALGDRVVPGIEEAGQGVEACIPFPESLASITPVLQQILLKIEEWRLAREIERVLLFYHEHISGAVYEPHMLYLLPLHLEWVRGLREKEWPSRILPMFTMGWDRLFSSLIRHYFFVSLYRAFAESLASESASRLAAMQAAEKNVEERLQELGVEFRQQRQSSITAEVLDIVAGFEALRTKRDFVT